MRSAPFTEYMARPRSKLRRDQQLNFSLTRDELTTLRQRADAAGMHLVDFGRGLLLRRRFTPTAQARESDSANWRLLTQAARLLVNELRRLGSNLNQITRRLHMLGEAAPPSLEPLLRDIRKLLNREPRHHR